MNKEELKKEFKKLLDTAITYPDNVVYKVIDCNAMKNDVEEKLKINKETLVKNQLEAAVIHSTLFRLMQDFVKKYKHVEKIYNTMYALKYDYYKYYSNKEIGYNEVLIYIKGDPDIAELNRLMEEHEDSIKYLTAMCDRIKNRGYEIKNIIEWEKFLQGG